MLTSYIMAAFVRIVCIAFTVFIIGCIGDQPEPTIPDRLGSAFGLFYDEYGDKEWIIYGDQKSGILCSFERPSKNDVPVNFTPLNSSFPYILKDEFGNEYDVFGREKEARTPNLVRSNGFNGYWFSVANFFPKPTIYNQEVQSSQLEEFDGSWLVDEKFVVQGAPRDAIPAINDPTFVPFNSELIKDSRNERALVVSYEDLYYVFPYSILNWHEVVNLDDYSVSFCPLTGTGFAHTNVDFGVSGLLYNNNLILYDKQTKSFWSQIYGLCVNGERKGDVMNILTAVDFRYSALSNIEDEENWYILSEETGYLRNYEENPYASYLMNDESFFYPNKVTDDRLLNKELVHALKVDQSVKVYRFIHFYD